MNGVTLFETQAVNDLIQQMNQVVEKVEEMHNELMALKKPYLSAQEAARLLIMSTRWLNDHKQDIGYTMVGGRLRFKRKDVDDYIGTNY